MYELASISGISGVEVQTVRSRLWDRETALIYKRESMRWTVRTVSMGGIMAPGASLAKPSTAEESIRKAIAGAEILGAGVVLVRRSARIARKWMMGYPTVRWSNCSRNSPPFAADAGAVLGLELSLSLEEHRQLIKLVAHAAVRIYWDAHDVDSMAHPTEGLTGIETLGDLICQQHLENGRIPLLEESGLIDWTKGLPAIKASGYQGWLAFETPPETPELCVEQTRRNLAFIKRFLG